MTRRYLCQAACGLAFLLALAGFAHAGSFSVSPVRVTLSADKPIQALAVRNDGDEPTVVQIELREWQQAQNEDLYQPTRDILATPPIFTVPAGESQVVRIGLRGAPDTDIERAYRVFLREVPPPPTPGSQGLRVALRLGVPVFVLPTQAAAPRLDWRAQLIGGGDIRLTLANSGNAHIQVANFTLTVNGRELETRHVASYVLPGQTRSWSIETGQELTAGIELHVAARTDSGDAQATLVVE